MVCILFFILLSSTNKKKIFVVPSTAIMYLQTLFGEDYSSRTITLPWEASIHVQDVLSWNTCVLSIFIMNSKICLNVI